MPKIELTRPVCRRGKLSITMALDSGTTGAPAPPCTMRQNTSACSESASPQKYVATENARIDPTITLRRPNRPTSQPVIGVTTAVARMLNVIAQAISSGVAAIAPCICGSSVEAISSVVEYSVDASITAIRIRMRRVSVSPAAGSWSDILACCPADDRLDPS